VWPANLVLFVNFFTHNVKTLKLYSLIAIDCKLTRWPTVQEVLGLIPGSGKDFYVCYAPRKISEDRIVAALSVRSSVRPSVHTSHSCPAQYFVIWSRIWKLFYRNDHHVETTCRAQNLGSCLKGQGHSATLQQNRVRPITLLFEVRFRNFFTEMITILRRCVARKIWVPALKVKVTARPCSKIVSGP